MKLKMRAALAPMLVMAVFATSAGAVQAATITPPNTEVLGFSTDAHFTAGSNTLSCPESHFVGRTTEPASDAVNVTKVTFGGACKNSEGLGETSATANASPTCPFVLLATEATGKGNGKLTFQIPQCGKVVLFIKSFGITICELVIGGQTLTGITFSNSEDKLTVNSPVSIVRAVGGAECGPASTTGTFGANYSTTPSNLEIN